jgi:hypothetical protein
VALLDPETLVDVRDDVQTLLTKRRYVLAYEQGGGHVWLRPDIARQNGITQ